MKRKLHCLTLDLKDQKVLIDTYEKFHRKIWPEITESIKEAGIEHMEIYRWNTRLFMIIEVNESFSFDRKARMDAENQKVQEWESLMSQFQQPLKGTSNNEKWQLMKKVFDLNENG